MFKLIYSIPGSNNSNCTHLTYSIWCKLDKTVRLILLLSNFTAVAFHPKGLTKDGFEMHIGVNHLGHFLLTNLLLPRIIRSAPARIIVVASKTHQEMGMCSTNHRHIKCIIVCSTNHLHIKCIIVCCSNHLHIMCVNVCFTNNAGFIFPHTSRSSKWYVLFYQSK